MNYFTPALIHDLQNGFFEVKDSLVMEARSMLVRFHQPYYAYMHIAYLHTDHAYIAPPNKKEEEFTKKLSGIHYMISIFLSLVSLSTTFTSLHVLGLLHHQLQRQMLLPWGSLLAHAEPELRQECGSCRSMLNLKLSINENVGSTVCVPNAML